MRTSLAVVFLVALTSKVALARISTMFEWTQYKIAHGKVYRTPEEDAWRFSHFLASKERIEKHNAESSQYQLGLNQFSDWAPEEFGKLLRDQPENLEIENTGSNLLNEVYVNKSLSLPRALDWRKHQNRVTPVKDQGNCTADWAFSAIGALEGQVIVRTETKELKSLSAQNIIDCTTVGHAKGCDGGTPTDAFSGIFAFNGLNSEADYPYVGKQEKCRAQENATIINDDGFWVSPMQEVELQSIVASWGPVSIGLGGDGWRDYRSGVFDSAACKYNKNSIYALIVGYGSDSKDGDFWIVKNSWSEKWGEAGYMRLRRGKRTCGVGYQVNLPSFG